MNVECAGRVFDETDPVVASSQAQLRRIDVLKLLYVTLTRSSEAIQRRQNPHSHLTVNAANIGSR
ncbi:MAG TPA: hypothetical protein VJS11_05835 [Acidobacteriaceae bacterium]|nr:hypothetical protein [Acidobacteriaceae bacterium]